MANLGLITGHTFENLEAYRFLEGRPGVFARRGSAAGTMRAYREGGWPLVGREAAAEARALAAEGAEVLVLAGATLHKVAGQVAEELASAGIEMPILHMADSLGREARCLGISSLGLMAARFVTSEGFIRYHLKDAYGLRVPVPQPAQVETVQSIIYEELVPGRVEEGSGDELLKVARSLTDLGAEALAVAFGGLSALIPPDELSCPVLDAAVLHAREAQAVLDGRTGLTLSPDRL